jgi:hypothetical protein
MSRKGQSKGILPIGKRVTFLIYIGDTLRNNRSE